MDFDVTHRTIFAGLEILHDATLTDCGESISIQYNKVACGFHQHIVIVKLSALSHLRVLLGER